MVCASNTFVATTPAPQATEVLKITTTTILVLIIKIMMITIPITTHSKLRPRRYASFLHTKASSGARNHPSATKKRRKELLETFALLSVIGFRV